MTKKKGINILLVLLTAAAVFALSFIGARMGMAGRVKADSVAEIPDAYSGVILAGYDRITLRAGQQEQSKPGHGIRPVEDSLGVLGFLVGKNRRLTDVTAKKDIARITAL